MKSLPFVEELERRCRTEGRSEGRSEGTLLALARIVARRLRRELSPAERDALGARLARDGDAVLDEVADLDARALEAWFASSAH